MKALTVTYEQLKNTGNYSHQKISIQLQVEDGERAKDVLAKAKEFVESELIDNDKINVDGWFFTKESAVATIEDKNVSVAKYEAANKAIDIFNLNETKDDLPF